MNFKSTHNLTFETEAYPIQFDDDLTWIQFQMGSCKGLYCENTDAYDLLVVVNDNPGNGHFNDVLEYLEYCCKRNNKKLRLREVWNHSLKWYMITKRGFVVEYEDDIIKTF